MTTPTIPRAAIDVAARAIFMNKEPHWQFDPLIHATKEVWTRSEREEYEGCVSDATAALQAAWPEIGKQIVEEKERADANFESCERIKAKYSDCAEKLRAMAVRNGEEISADATFQDACIDAIKLLESGGYGAPGKPNTLRAMAAEASAYRQQVAAVMERLRAEIAVRYTAADPTDETHTAYNHGLEVGMEAVDAALAELGIEKESNEPTTT